MANNNPMILSDEQMQRVMVMEPMFSDDQNNAHYVRMGRAVEKAVSASAMVAALDLIVRRLEASINDGSRLDQWSMEDLVLKARAAMPAGWVIGEA